MKRRADTNPVEDGPSITSQQRRTRTRSTSKDPAFVISSYQQAMQLVGSKRYAHAEVILTDILSDPVTLALAAAQHPPLETHNVQQALDACLWASGHWPSAVALLRSMLLTLPEGDIRRLELHRRLTRRLEIMGRHAEEENELERSAEAHTKQLGPWHPDTLEVRHNLAVSYDEAGKHEAAEGILKSVYAAGMSHPQMGWTHDRTCLTASALGACLMRMNKYAEARPYLVHAVRVWAPKHPITHRPLFAAACDAAECLYKLEEYPEAEALFRLLIAAHEHSFGEDLSDRDWLLWAKYRLAAAMGGQDSKKRRAAIPLVREITASSCEAVAPDHPVHIRAQLGLAACLIGVQEYVEARRLIGDLRTTCAAKHGPDADITLAVEKMWSTFLRKTAVRSPIVKQEPDSHNAH